MFDINRSNHKFYERFEAHKNFYESLVNIRAVFPKESGQAKNACAYTSACLAEQWMKVSCLPFMPANLAHPAARENHLDGPPCDWCRGTATEGGDQTIHAVSGFNSVSAAAF